MNKDQPAHQPNSSQSTGLTISARSLSKRFNREWIFRNFTYEFSSGNTYAITGPNGSGKSTLLQVLWAQMPPTEGDLLITKNGNILPAEELYSTTCIAAPYMDLIDELTLEEHMSFHFGLKKPRPGLSIESIINLSYLDRARTKQVGNFSSGMKQRLKLALALYTEADVIFLDEPGANLDDVAFAWYRESLAKLPPETIVFIASNNPNEYPSGVPTIHLPAFKKALN